MMRQLELFFSSFFFYNNFCALGNDGLGLYSGLIGKKPHTLFV